MPNWAEGNIRFRGKPEKIMEFLKNEIECTATNKEFEVVTNRPVIEWTEFDEINFSEPEEAKKENNFWKSLYIKGTRRNFIDGISGVYLPRDTNEWILCLDNFKAAWGVITEPYAEKSKKYGIDIAIVVYEQGMEFRQRIEIINGEIVKCEETKYKDWNWEADFPNMGG